MSVPPPAPSSGEDSGRTALHTRARKGTEQPDQPPAERENTSSKVKNTAGRQGAGTAAHLGDRHPRVWYPDTCTVWEGTELLPPLLGPVWIPALPCSDCFSRPAASRPAQLTCGYRPPLRPLGPRVLRPHAPREAQSAGEPAMPRMAAGSVPPRLAAKQWPTAGGGWDRAEVGI